MDLRTNRDGSARNAGDEPLDVYVVSLTSSPAETASVDETLLIDVTISEPSAYRAMVFIDSYCIPARKQLATTHGRRSNGGLCCRRRNDSAGDRRTATGVCRSTRHAGIDRPISACCDWRAGPPQEGQHIRRTSRQHNRGRQHRRRSGEGLPARCSREVVRRRPKEASTTSRRHQAAEPCMSWRLPNILSSPK